MLVDVSGDEEPEGHFVRVSDTLVGKGVFAERAYPETAIIGEIKGDIVPGSEQGSEYTFDFEDGMQLEPYSPFRFVNHSCEPNCEFEILDEGSDRRALFLIAIRDIRQGEEFSISYNWPASCAIECHCGSDNCVGWIVCESEIDQVIDRYEDDFEPEYEFHKIGFFDPDEI